MDVVPGAAIVEAGRAVMVSTPPVVSTSACVQRKPAGISCGSPSAGWEKQFA